VQCFEAPAALHELRREHAWQRAQQQKIFWC
jgi:hypothetical protein